MDHLIDCHILTLSHFDARWIAELRQDLDGEPVHQHWMAGIEGNLGRARAAGYAAGIAPFVTSADPDDRIMPGTFAALHQALIDHPFAPFAWAGEQLVDENLQAFDIRPNVWPGGYDPFLHLTRGTHVHGVKLYRREAVMPALDAMARGGLCCEFLLDYLLAQPHTNSARQPPGQCMCRLLVGSGVSTITTEASDSRSKISTSWRRYWASTQCRR